MPLSPSDRILVTGGAGFLGSFVIEELNRKGYHNLVIPRRKDYDLTTEEGVVRLYDDAKPSAVIHLAAEVGGIGANRENPGRYFFANMAMGLHLIEHGRRRNLQKFVQVGTICAYPNLTPVPFKESDLWLGYPEVTNAPYGIAKKALLVMLQGYRQQYQFPGVYLLPVNLYGPRDNFDLKSSHVIPALIRKIVEARDAGRPTVEAWGTGSASREFLYAPDCAQAIVLAAENYESPDPINLGSGREISIKNLTELVASIANFKGSIVWDPTKPDGQPRRCLDVSRAKSELGWTAQTPLEQGLHQTLTWYESHRK